MRSGLDVGAGAKFHQMDTSPCFEKMGVQVL